MRTRLGLVLLCSGGCFTDSSADGGTDAPPETTEQGPTTAAEVTTTERGTSSSTSGATTRGATTRGDTTSSDASSSGDTSGSSTGAEPQWNPELMWLHVFDSGIDISGDRVDEVVIDPGGSVWVAGAFAWDMAPSQIFVAELTIDGEPLETHLYDDPALTNARGLAAVENGLFIGGHTASVRGGTDRFATEFRSGAMSCTESFDFGEPPEGDDIVHAVAAEGAQRFAAGTTQEDGVQRAWVARILPFAQAWTHLAGEYEGNNRALEVRQRTFGRRVGVRRRGHQPRRIRRRTRPGRPLAKSRRGCGMHPAWLAQRHG